MLLVLAKFMRVLDIDPLARTARVQPGVRNLAISEAVAAHGLYYAPDPSSQLACTIGGNVAENSGGVHCLKYGLTVHNILKLRVLTIEGEALEIGSDALDYPGYDLLALMTGSEGLLAVITEITVRLLPKPQCAQVVMAAFDDVEKAGHAVASVIAAGIIPAGLEMMDGAATRAVEPFVHAGYPTDAPPPCCCANRTARLKKSRTKSRAWNKCCTNAVRSRCARRRAKTNASACGPGARRHSRPSAAWRPTTTAWTAQSRASASPKCCGRSNSCRRSTR